MGHGKVGSGKERCEKVGWFELMRCYSRVWLQVVQDGGQICEDAKSGFNFFWDQLSSGV